MKRLFTVIIVTFIGSLYSENTKKTILDYFNEIEHPALLESLKDEIDSNHSISKEDVLKAKLSSKNLIIDIPNYFIQVTDKGGLGRHYRQYALYSPDKEPIFAISRQHTYMNCTKNYVTFLSKQAGKWADITKDIFPKISLDSFAKEPAKIRARDVLKEFGAFKYILPRNGTTIKIEYDLVSYEWENSGRSEAEARKILSPLTYKAIEVEWQKTERRFVLKRRIIRD